MLADGESLEIRGSSGSVYELRNVGGVYSCSCPAWRNQSHPAHQRTCKHLRTLLGEAAELARLASSGRSSESVPAAARPAGDAGPPLLLAHSWDQVTDLSGWWMSEKLDGVRAYWDGERLISRLGNAFVAPTWFTEKLPLHPLDGELWGGRKRFQRTVSVVRRQDASDQWRDIRYVVFDAPHREDSFENRQAFCREAVEQAGEHCQLLEQEPCRGVDHLRSELRRVEEAGGEGLMLRRPDSRYEVGRSWSLLKVKSFQDAEGMVVGHLPGEGKHTGRLGALQLQMANGTRVSVGTGLSDADRRQPPPLGATVTFRFQELSDGGVPRFPVYVGQRCDLVLKIPKQPEVSMQVVQAGLTEACDLHSQGAQERLGALLGALQAYAGGSVEGLRAYSQQYPFSRVKDALGPPPAVTARLAPEKPSPAATAVEGGYRRFEFEEGGSSKFWEVAVEGANQTVRYGRLGTAGQSKTKTFGSEAEARKDTDKLMAEKRGKGYEEV